MAEVSQNNSKLNTSDNSQIETSEITEHDPLFRSKTETNVTIGENSSNW